MRGGSRTAATSKVELFVIIVDGWKLLTIITKSSTLDVAAVLDPPMTLAFFKAFYLSSSAPDVRSKLSQIAPRDKGNSLHRSEGVEKFCWGIFYLVVGI